jgi:hypothetical protein
MKCDFSNMIANNKGKTRVQDCKRTAKWIINYKGKEKYACSNHAYAGVKVRKL